MTVNNTSATIIIIAALGIGIGAGIGIKTLLDTKKTNPVIVALNEKKSNTLPFVRAQYIKQKYEDERRAQRRIQLERQISDMPKRPETECIVHNIDDFVAYAKKLETFFRDYEDSIQKNKKQEFPTKFKPGVALYFSKTYDYNYMQINSKDTNFLLRDKYTIFMAPVHFSEVRQEIPFHEISNGDDYWQGDDGKNLKVLILDSLISPFNKNAGITQTYFYKKAFKFFNEDPGAFDLSHTKP
jgi:hypothetical protein